MRGDMNMRPLSSPGSVAPAPYECSKNMLEFKADLVMCDTRELDGWPLEFRERVYNALVSRARVLEGENTHG